jgi:hypothetical protein
MLLLFPITGFASCLWGFVDVLTRPAALLRVAGVSKSKWSCWFAAIPILLAMLGGLIGLGASGRILGLGYLLVGEPAGFIGFAMATWYFLVVRRWVSAQLGFAELRSAGG